MNNARVILVVLPALLSGCEMNDGSKNEWGILQAIESDNRGIEIAGIEFREIDKYAAAGFKSTTDNVWVLLNPKYEPYYKQIPSESNFSISVSELEEIYRSGASDTVMQCLKSHLTNIHK